MNPKNVSVVICSHNHENYIQQTLDSVLMQGQPFREILLIDAESTDKTAQIAKSDSRIRYKRCDNRSIAETYNQAVEAAAGEVLCMLDGDDYWSEDFWKTLSRWHEKFSDTQVSIGKMRNFIDSGFGVNSQDLPTHYELEPYGFSTLCIHSEVFRSVGYFDSKYSVAADMEWLVRVKDAGIRVTEIPEVMAHRRLHNKNSLANFESSRLGLTTHLLRESIWRKRQAGK